MRIEIGPEGQVIGTKRVNTNGQIGGLKSFAGQDLLVVQPGSRAEYTFTVRDRLHQARVLVAEQARATREEAGHLIQTLRADGGLQKAFETYVEAPLKESVSTTRSWVKDRRDEWQARWEAAQNRAAAEVAQRRAQARQAAESLERRVEGRRRDVEEAAVEIKRKFQKQAQALGLKASTDGGRKNGKKATASAAA